MWLAEGEEPETNILPVLLRECAHSCEALRSLSPVVRDCVDDFARSPCGSNQRHGTDADDFPAPWSMPVRICLLDSRWTLVRSFSLRL